MTLRFQEMLLFSLRGRHSAARSHPELTPRTPSGDRVLVMLHVVIGCGQTGNSGRHWLTDGGTGTATSLVLLCTGDRCGAALLGGTSQVTGARGSSEEVVPGAGPSVWRLWWGRDRGRGVSGPGDGGARTVVQGRRGLLTAQSLTQGQCLHTIPETTENWVMVYVRR